jgi:hypothetical protein
MGVYSVSVWGRYRDAGLTNVCRSEDVLDGLGDLRANAVTLDQADEVVALSELLASLNCTELLRPSLSDFHRPFATAYDVSSDNDRNDFRQHTFASLVPSYLATRSE